MIFKTIRHNGKVLNLCGELLDGYERDIEAQKLLELPIEEIDAHYVNNFKVAFLYFERSLVAFECTRTGDLVQNRRGRLIDSELAHKNYSHGNTSLTLNSTAR